MSEAGSSSNCAKCQLFHLSLLEGDDVGNTLVINNKLSAYHAYHQVPRISMFYCLACRQQMVPLLPSFQCSQCNSQAIVASSAASAGAMSIPSASMHKLLVDVESRNFLQLIRRRAELDLHLLRTTLKTNGISWVFRGDVWKLLLDAPPQQALRSVVAREQQQQYFLDVAKHTIQMQKGQHQELVSQIAVDIPRTHCLAIPGFMEHDKVVESITRILFIWSRTHGSAVGGYFQGLNEVLIPLFAVYYSTALDKQLQSENVVSLLDSISRESQLAVESDVYHSLSLIMERLRRSTRAATNQIPAVYLTDLLERLVEGSDRTLSDHLRRIGVQFMFFSFRWHVALMYRELPFPLIVELWDQYLLPVEPWGMASVHVYFCAAFLYQFRDRLLGLDTTDALIFLQKLPTSDWTCKELRTILLQSFLLKKDHPFAQDELKQNYNGSTPSLKL